MRRAPNAQVGAIDVFDLNATGNPFVATILPPPIPGNSLPCGVRGFGHYLDIADINGDETKDLIVGAANSDLNEGRVYIFFGHPNFFPDPPQTPPGWTQKWMIVRPPADPIALPGCEPCPVAFPPLGTFGFSLAAGDLNDDGFADLLVGRPERGYGPGRAHLFTGRAITEAISSNSFVDWTPTAPANIHEGVNSEYQTLEDPATGLLGPDDDASFGWIVDIPDEDLGGPIGPLVGFDDKPDLLIHAEGTFTWGVDANEVVTGGALFAFFGTAVPPTEFPLVDADQPLRLETPRIPDDQGQPLYYPQPQARFGRAFGVADWKKVNGSATKILLVGEPDRGFSMATSHAGAVFAFELPLDQYFDPTDPATIDDPHHNAWGSFVLREPSDALGQNMQAPLDVAGAMASQAGANWGGWIVTGVYDTLFPGQQVIISARARTLPNPGMPSQPYIQNGRVYALTLPTP